jgi:small-conductance mechanosensitive channel
MLNYRISIGEIRFSFMNVINAIIVIVLTQTLARFWRFVLKEKILPDSGMSSGLQDSITMISVYAVWAFGIMLSLHTFGMGTTTLALAFGALGIGLGFGLQNIFNNFISGIILLFERPIQVGDDVEINGIWATVKKINVRATVVQTYDNASIIIPNSEFISSQVTNWSFKDKRLRRNIDVGVAYGSDIELVRKTMLEIADKTQKVYKQPKPDLIFKDFGDSALIFRLRVWTDIDNMFKVETAIRFEIDRLFKERNIVIAFPQRDVHLFTDTAPQKGDTKDLKEKTV